MSIASSDEIVAQYQRLMELRAEKLREQAEKTKVQSRLLAIMGIPIVHSSPRDGTAPFVGPRPALVLPRHNRPARRRR